MTTKKSRKVASVSPWMTSFLYELKKISPVLIINPDLSIPAYMEAKGQTTPKNAAELYAAKMALKSKGV